MPMTSGPLLQRAGSDVIQYDHNTTSSVYIDIPEQVPQGWVGTTSVCSTDCVNALRNWYFNSTLVNTSRKKELGDISKDLTRYKCPANSTCYGTVHGAGIGHSCSTRSYKLNTSDPSIVDVESFSTQLTAAHWSNPLILRLDTLSLSHVEADCMGTVFVDTCFIWSATVRYPFRLVGLIMDVGLNGTVVPDIVSNYTSPGDQFPVTNWSHPIGPLLGLWFNVGNLVNVNESFSGISNVQSGGLQSNIFLTPNQSRIDCAIQYQRQTDYVLGAIKSFMFRLAFESELKTEAHRQDVPVKVVTHMTVYSANYQFLAAALVTMLTGLVAVLSLFWGWWELDRAVTMSPLETARAFGAPLLQEGQAKGVHQMLDEVGKKRVRYEDGKMVIEG
jgi:hypothetical protein